MGNVLRSMRRGRAKRNLKLLGNKKFCKHSHTQGVNLNGKPGDKIRDPSYFSENWRKFANGTVNKRRKGA